MSEILTWIFGGSAIAALSSIVTLGAVRKEAQGKAEQAHADADAVKITNTENATRILVENIVEPLKQELNETRRELSSFKREVVRLRKAIDAANSCRYHDDCPVLDQLRDEKNPSGVQESRSSGVQKRGQHARRDGNPPSGRERGGVAGKPDAVG